MARIVVTGPQDALAGRALLDRLVTRVRQDGHDAVPLGGPEAPLGSIREADAVIAVLDGQHGPSAAAAAMAHALGKPVLGLHGRHTGPDPLLLEACSRVHGAEDEAGLLEGLPAFYEDVRPFAGRLVRDQVPRLVQEAGHAVEFREVPEEDRPRFLKQKVAEEAGALAEGDRGDEPEEVADVLEALEAFLRARGIDREHLKGIKDSKRKNRGGFDRCFVVEATAEDAAPKVAAP